MTLYSNMNWLGIVGLRQSASLVINQITVDGFASLFNYMTVGRASDSMMGPTQSLLIYLSWLVLDLVLSVAWLFGVQLGARVWIQ